MRGTPKRALCRSLTVRIIPADAGNTRYHTVMSDQAKDHPRGCGEHTVLKTKALSYKGSSPRMRGTLYRRVRMIQKDRIIPADAGNTFICSFGWVAGWDHPRGCGEHDINTTPFTGAHGSSPRMRGTQASSWFPKPQHWIIPADAGNTHFQRKPRLKDGDHPRGCGEHSWSVNRVLTVTGSSPRMRGTHRA